VIERDGQLWPVGADRLLCPFQRVKLRAFDVHFDEVDAREFLAGGQVVDVERADLVASAKIADTGAGAGGVEGKGFAGGAPESVFLQANRVLERGIQRQVALEGGQIV